MDVVERNKDGPSLHLVPCKFSMSLKKIANKKKLPDMINDWRYLDDLWAQIILFQWINKQCFNESKFQ